MLSSQCLRAPVLHSRTPASYSRAPVSYLRASVRPRSGSRTCASEPNSTSTTDATSVPAASPSKGTSRGPAAVNDSISEQLFYEGSASNAELIISLLLAFTLVYIPITIAVIGKKLWFKYTFTNKRVKITNSSPLFANTVEVAYKNISEIRTAPRAFGLWGDCVIFLKDGSRLELTGLEKYKEIKQHVLSCMYD